MSPLLAAQGLSLAAATVADVLAIEGLADAVVAAAATAVSPARDLDWRDLDAMASGAPIALRAPASAARLPAAPAAVPDGWQLHVDLGPRHLKFDEDGEPCYPDAPPFEEFWPKCPPPDLHPPPPEVPCLEDLRFVRAEERLRERDDFWRIPSSFRGFDYRAELERSVVEPAESLYACGAGGDGSLLASWHGAPAAQIRVYEPLLDLDLGLGFDLVSTLTMPVAFRAAVLLHEHVHRIEDPGLGTVSAPADRDYHPVGSQGQDDCPLSGTEYDAAYLQALYLGASEPVARAVGDIYGRRQCGRLSRSAQLLAAAGDIIEALALGWVASLEVVIALTTHLGDGEAAARLLDQIFLPGVAATLIVGLRCFRTCTSRPSPDAAGAPSSVSHP